MTRWKPDEIILAINLQQSGFTWESITDQLADKFNVTRTPDAVRKQIEKHSKPTPPVVAQAKVDTAIVPISESTGVKTIVVYADVHIPFHDPVALAIMMKITKDIKPDMIVIDGDLVEFYGASSFFSKMKPQDAPHLNEEIEIATNHLSILRNQHKKAVIHYIGGNHEDRMLRLLAVKAPQLLGIEALSVPSLLRLDDLNIHYHPPVAKESYINFGNLLIGHFDSVYSNAAYTAKNLVMKKGMSLIQAHTHRQGIYNVTWLPRQVIGVECGCLCKCLEYKESPNWQQGFCVVKFFGKYFTIHLVQIIRTTEGVSFASYGDKFYSMKHDQQSATIMANEKIDRRVKL